MWESFFVESMSVPNFMKIKEGQDFFVDLVWNDPYAKDTSQAEATSK